MIGKAFYPYGLFQQRRYSIYLADEVIATGDREKNYNIASVANCLHPYRWGKASDFFPPSGIQSQNTDWWRKRTVDYNFSRPIRTYHYFDRELVKKNEKINLDKYENYIIVETTQDRLQFVLNPSWIFGAFIDILTKSPVRCNKYIVKGRTLTMNDLGKTYGELLQEGIFENKCTVYLFQIGEKVEIPQNETKSKPSLNNPEISFYKKLSASQRFM